MHVKWSMTLDQSLGRLMGSIERGKYTIGPIDKLEGFIDEQDDRPMIILCLRGREDGLSTVDDSVILQEAQCCFEYRTVSRRTLLEQREQAAEAEAQERLAMAEAKLALQEEREEKRTRILEIYEAKKAKAPLDPNEISDEMLDTLTIEAIEKRGK